MNLKSLVPAEKIEGAINFIRGERVILDFDLATIYEVEIRTLIQAIKRNSDRFPHDFAFQLTQEEVARLRSQFAISKKTEGRGGRRYRPYAFTEHGAIMAANVLRSKRAVKASIYVIRAFVKLRQLVASHKELAAKFDELERTVATHDKAIVSLFEAIREMMTPPPPKKKRIGFIQS